MYRSQDRRIVDIVRMMMLNTSDDSLVRPIPGSQSPILAHRAPRFDRKGTRMTELSGLKAIVTGGGSGIGLAVALRLAGHGAEVAVLGLHPGGALNGFVTDVADDASVRSAVRAAAGLRGGVDILGNNAGIGAAGTGADNPDDPGHRVRDL